MTYRFYINDNEYFPMKSRDLSIIKTKEGVRYRTKLDGEINLNDIPELNISDFSRFKEEVKQNPYKKHHLKITKNGKVKHEAYFIKEDLDFNVERKTITFKPQDYDKYTPILENKDIEVDIVDSDESVTVKAVSYLSFYYTMMDDVFVDQKKEGYSLYYTYNEDTRIFATERVVLPKLVTTTDWLLIEEGNDYNVWGREPVDYPTPTDDEISMFPTYTEEEFIERFREFFTEEELEPGSLLSSVLVAMRGLQDNKSNHEIYDPKIHRKEIIPMSGNYDFDIEVYISKAVYNGGQYVPDITLIYQSTSLKAILIKLLERSGYGIKSTFLFDDAICKGEIDPFNGSHPPLEFNYVTRQALKEYRVVEESDFLRPLYENKAIIGYTTFDEFVTALKNQFNLEWHIDKEGCFRIEHVSYYEQLEKGIDVSSSLLLNRNYFYDNSEIPKRQIFEFAKSGGEDFTKKEIEYSEIPTISGSIEKTEVLNIAEFATDIDHLNKNLDSISGFKFVLLETDHGKVVEKEGVVSKTTGQNYGLSIANCLDLYHKHNAYFPEAIINGTPTDTLSLKRLKRQSTQFIAEEEIDETKSIETKIGQGRIESLTIPIVQTGKTVVKAELSYE